MRRLHLRLSLGVLLVISLLGATAALASTTVTIVNGGSPGWIKFDTAGNGLDAHDGEIKEFFGKYYLYGTSYGCGYVRMQGYGSDTHPATPFCGFKVYESTDLRHWTDDGLLFDPKSAPPRSPTDWQATCNSATLSCYRPHVLYDFARHRFVLWVNTYDSRNGVAHGYHVLTSTSPTGPFTEAGDGSGHAALPNLAFATGGDFDLYQDTDAAHTGYITYVVRRDPLGSRYGYKLVVERLSRDYLTGSGVYTTLDTSHTEGPSMFRRGGDYYVTMSDPMCAYCAGTGAAYLRARSPLGPWHGVGGSVATGLRQMYVEGVAELFHTASSTTNRLLSTLRTYDVQFRAAPMLDTRPGSTHHASIGWMFRAKNTATGYLWMLSNVPYHGKAARLTKYVLSAGRILHSTTTPVAVPLLVGKGNYVKTRALGTTFTTWLNGVRIDTTTDKTWGSGWAGVRESGQTSAYYDNFSVALPTSRGYHVYASDTFTTGSLANWPAFNTYRRHGVQFSSTSCGGQPADVAQLRDSTGGSGWQYIFQSDRWDKGDPNEGQALQYWEPLRFNADGGLQALRCGATFTTTLADATLPAQPTANDEGYEIAQDISADRFRGQSFQIGADANLNAISLVLFQDDDATTHQGPDADLVVSLYDEGADPNFAGQPIASAVVARSTISWSPRTMTVPLQAPLTANTDGTPHNYAFVLSTTSHTGRYGTSVADATLHPATADSGFEIGFDGGLTGRVLTATPQLMYSLSLTTTAAVVPPLEQVPDETSPSATAGVGSG